MDAFHHVLSLLTFVFALSLTGLLTRVSTLFVVRERVSVSPLAILAALNCALLVFLNWLSLWEIRDVTDWNLVKITTVFLFTLSIYFTCTLALPHPAGDGPINMRGFYDKERVPFYTSWLICELLAITTNLELAGSTSANNLSSENVVNTALVVPIVLALCVRRTWAQYLGAFGIMAAHIVFLLAFEEQLT